MAIIFSLVTKMVLQLVVNENWSVNIYVCTVVELTILIFISKDHFSTEQY